MAYPAKYLNPAEQVVLDVRPHWKFLFGPVAAVVLVIAGAVVALARNIPRWGLLAVAALLVVCLLWLAVRYLKWSTKTFVVTNQRLIVRQGVLRRLTREILIDRLTDISYRQTLLDRLTGCGDILLESPGRDSQEVFEDLPHPARIQNEIYRLVNERQAGYAWASPSAPSPSAPPASH